MKPSFANPIGVHDIPSPNGHRQQRQFHAMAKPVSSTCNLDCTYCYYLSKAMLSDGPGAGRMSDEVLELFIKQYIDGVTGPEVVFSWQGGEPTLLGLEFFQKVVALEKKHAKPNQKIQNDLQTNGTLLNEEWCEFLKANHFLVGLSIDGPKEIHDYYRITKGGKPTFDIVFNAAKLLQRHGVPFNTLTCVNRFNGRRPLDVYRFLTQELNSTHIQFIPIVEHKTFEKAAPQTWDPAILPRDGEPVMLAHFETLVAQHLGLPSLICVYSKNCGKAVAVENDGSVYSCDHYMYPECRLGNLKNSRLGDMVFSPPQKRFGQAKSETLPEYCRSEERRVGKE